MNNQVILIFVLLVSFLFVGCTKKTDEVIVSTQESDSTLWIEQAYEKKIQVMQNSFYFVNGESITKKIAQFGIPLKSTVDEQRTPYEPNDVYGRTIYSEYPDFAINYFVPDDPAQTEILLFLDIFGNNPLLDTDFKIGMSRNQIIETFTLEPDFESENDLNYEIGLGSPDGEIIFYITEGFVYRITVRIYLYY